MTGPNQRPSPGQLPALQQMRYEGAGEGPPTQATPSKGRPDPLASLSPRSDASALPPLSASSRAPASFKHGPRAGPSPTNAFDRSRSERSSVLGFDGGLPRKLPPRPVDSAATTVTATPQTAAGAPFNASQAQAVERVQATAQPPNYRIGYIEADYDAEIVTGLDVVEYYATFGHRANIKLFHLAPVNPPHEGNHYDLIVVPRDMVPPEHFTMSASGIVHVRPAPEPGRPPETDFKAIGSWLREMSVYRLMCQMRVFKLYLYRKMFRIWRNAAHSQVFHRTRRNILSNALLAKPTFTALLMDVKRIVMGMCSEPLAPFVGPRQVWVRRETGRWELVNESGNGNMKLPIAEYTKMQDQHTKTIVEQRYSIAVKQIVAMLGKVIEDVNRSAKYLEETVSAFANDPSAGATRGLSAPRVKLERLEKQKTAREALRARDRLRNIVRLVDYIVVESLVDVLNRDLTYLRALLGACAMVHCAVELDPGCGVRVTPPEQVVGVAVARQLKDSFLDFVKSRERIVSHQALVEAGLPPLPPTARLLDVNTVVLTSRAVNSAKLACDGAVTASFSDLQAVADELEDLRPIYEFTQSWDGPAYKAQERDVEQFRTDMMLMRYFQKHLDNVTTGRRVGMIWMDVSTMLSEMRTIVTKALTTLCLVLEIAAHERLVATLSALQATVRKLQGRPLALHDFAAYLEAFTEMREREHEEVSNCEAIDEMYTMLVEYGGKMRADDEVILQDLRDAVEAFKNGLTSGDKFVQDMKAEQVVKLQSEVKALLREVEDIEAECGSGRFDDVTQDMAEALKALRELDAKFQTFADRTQRFERYEQLFELPQRQDFSGVQSAGKELAFHKGKWDLLSSFHDSRNGWMTGKISELDPAVVQAKVDDLNKHNYKMLKQHGNDEVVTKLKTELDGFKEQLPLLQEMANPALEERHWAHIFAIVEQPFQPGQDFCVEDLLHFGIIDKLEEVQTVATTASKEYSMLKALKKMEKEWDGMEIKVMPYKDSGTYIVGGLDDIQTILDDQIVKVQAMNASPFVKPFKERSAAHEAMLQTLQDMLDSWLQCQATWLYLEPIFSSDDIVKQMPEEGEKFRAVDGTWRDVMAATAADPAVIAVARDASKLDRLNECNGLLDEIQKGLAAYLEKKRLFFPRFFFLSNDEMLEILSETKDPTRVQPHLKKCFEGIDQLTFTDDLEITHMNSVEKESVPFKAVIDTNKARGSVEKWLLEVEGGMFESIHDVTRQGIEAYRATARHDWVLQWPGMVVLVVTALFWTEGVTAALAAADARGYEKQCTSDLLKIVDLVRGELTKLQRATLGALVVMDVHARDVVTTLADDAVVDPADFAWQAQLRSYWVDDDEGTKGKTVKMHMMSAELEFGYEYLGNSSRLVITPLTDRCYRTLMGAIHLTLGGAPEGPAGTGKTETTKDLAKALARQCVVFNCSDSLDYIAMGKFFKGLASSGAWACFDEFNRIDLEVLSVVAQQVLDIQRAIGARLKRFTFEGTEMQLKWSAWCSITMNPGYAGRSELPDNLKALFRTVAMMVPDYAMISEIILFSFGYLQARECAKKIVQCYKLCSEQLSSQDHYDYGMRAVIAVLRAAGNLKRRFPAEDEYVLMLRSIIDVNLCKFLSDDVPLFRGIVGDLFLGVVLPKPDYTLMEAAMTEQAATMNLQPTEYFFQKTIQLYEMIVVRHGLMIVGLPFAAKTSSYRLLAGALTRMAERGEDQQERVEYHVINPKSITMGQLYGQFDPVSHEWTDGILAVTFRVCASNPSPDRKWLMLDGPVDAIWIENMNTVLDDNKKLCLNSGEIIQMSASMNMIFEVMDLAVASPATVSRCGMVYMDADQIGWRPLTLSWLATFPEHFDAAAKAHVLGLFDWLVPVSLRFMRREVKEASPTLNGNVIVALHRVFSASAGHLLDEAAAGKTSASDTLKHAEAIFLFALTWSVGCTAATVQGRAAFDAFLRAAVACALPEYESPSGEKYTLPEDIPSGHVELKGAMLPNDKGATIYESFFDSTSGKFKPWDTLLDNTPIPEDAELRKILVQTVDSVRYTYLLDLAVRNNYPCLFVGPTGTGKSVYVLKYLNELEQDTFVPPIVIGFSARTTANMTQYMIDAKLDRRRKGVFGPPASKRVVIFVDDLNMPQLETYGAQPPIEILRQYMDHDGWYDRANTFRKMVDTQFVAAMGPPGGGRNFITPRYSRHFNHIAICDFDSKTMKRIFSTILDWSFSKGPFPDAVKELRDSVVAATLDVYSTSMSTLLPTPTKSHYLFNLRDISRVMGGLLLASPSSLGTGSNAKSKFTRLWVHEILRVFYDRLTDDQDRNWLMRYLKNVTQERLGADFDGLFKHLLPSGTTELGLEELRTVFFGDYMDTTAEEAKDRAYDEVQDMSAVLSKMEEFLVDHNATSKRPMNLALFLYAIEHVSRACRVLKQPGAHLLNVGVGGSGRQSLSRLAAFVNDMETLQIEISKSYTSVEWREDLKRFTRMAGGEGKSCVFLFSDTQIKSESFVEDINNLLNAGEVPNMFPYDERAAILELCRTGSKKEGLALETPAELWNYFIDKTKANLHVVLCFSPIGDAFRERLRQFPSLVNCCTIDWYTSWPRDALEAVAIKFLKEVDVEERQRVDLMEMCKMFHEDVRDLSERFRRNAGRINYVTPTSYLELLTMFTTLLTAQRGLVSTQQRRYTVGLEKLEFTENQVSVMQKELEALQPNLIQTVKETEELMAKVKKEKEEVVEPKKAIVDAEVAKAEESAAAANAIKTECEAALAVAMPVLEAALKALDTIKPADIKLIQSFKSPPGAIKLVMEAVCVLLDIKPAKIPDPSGSGKKIEDYWEPSKKALSDPNFVKSLLEYDKDNIPPKIIATIRGSYTSNPEFTPANAAKASSAAEGLCKWVCAMDSYEEVAKVVAPKREALAIAQGEYNEVMAALTIKQAELKEVMDNLAGMEQTLSDSMEKKANLEAEVELCSQKLDRAEKLIGGLGGEKVRWTESAAKLGVVYINLTGDMLISAGVIGYLGAFTLALRDEVNAKWVGECKARGIASSARFSLMEALGEPVKIRNWTIHGLPNDAFSIDNGIMVDVARRWPLMIDPQSQANKWIKSMERGHDLRVIKLTDGDYMRTLENAIQFGIPVLLENVGEELDPSLEPLLLKQIVKQGGVKYIHLGDAQVEFSDQFRFYITTSLRNPHYLPETAVKVTLLNFMITQDGLSDQLLGVTVAEERPDLEEQRQKLVIESAENKQKLKEIEDKILKVLSESEGNILEDATAIQILSEAKTVSNEIEEKQVIADETQREIDEARKDYAPCGVYNAILFFCIRDLAGIDPMYQYSLTWFIKLFVRSIQNAERHDDLPQRLKLINDHFTYSLYVNICRSLFEKDKLLFAFLLDVRIMMSQRLLTADRYTFLLTGGVGIQEKAVANPATEWISPKAWSEICRAATLSTAFATLPDDIASNLRAWRELFDASEPQAMPLPGAYAEELSDYDKLLVIRMIRPDKLIPAMSAFVSATMGSRFVEPPPFDLAGSFKESSVTAPLLFVLSSGSDPTAALLKYADENGYASKISIISMGQGQGPKAAKLITEGRKNGTWVLLQNCHLAASWMPALEKICEGIKPENTDGDFRLWITSMPSPAFPVTILQNAVKMTNEPPTGLRANLKRSYALDPISRDDDFFETCNKPEVFKRMLFGLCFVHAFVQERRKFGPIGWNIPYGFDDGDLRISARQLHMYVNDNQETPFAALKYAIGECNYGGRVTDDKDRRLLNTILDRVYRPEILTEKPFALSASGVYAVPEAVGPRSMYLEEISKLPLLPQPEAFGLHDNADITKDLQQTEGVTSTLLMCGGGSGGEGGGGEEALVAHMVQDILAKLPPQFDIEKAQYKYPVRYEESLNQVLCQEMLRYNRLTAIIRSSLLNLDKAIRGLQVMNAQLDEVFKSMAVGLVPALWKGKSFPSLKPLAGYVADLLARLKMFSDWYDHGAPRVFWLPGFFFTPSFSTAALQNYARARKLPIDTVGYDFEMQGVDHTVHTEAPRDGVLVYGLYLEGCAWDEDSKMLCESRPKVLFEAAPVIWLKPMPITEFPEYPHYSCPVYRTAERKGVLATTGHSTNFLMFIKMPSDQPQYHWILRGVCMLQSLSE